MNSVPRDFVTVDMRGLKAQLEALARSERRTVSDLVRVAVAERWGLCATRAMNVLQPPAVDVDESGETRKVSMRLTRREAELLDAQVRRAGLPRGVLVAGLLECVPLLADGGRHADHLAALIASTSEMATLARDIAQLSALLRNGGGPETARFRVTLETLHEDVRGHLAFASAQFRALAPRRGNHDAEGGAR